MAQRATSLGPKPSLFFLLFLFFLFLLFVFWGGFTGQVRWPKGPPHLALIPPYFFLFFVFVFFFFVFPSLFLIEEMLSPIKKGIFVHYSVFPFVSFQPLWGLLVFHFLFFCLSRVIFFLPSFLFLISVSGSCFLFSCFYFKLLFRFCFSVCCLVCFES